MTDTDPDPFLHGSGSGLPQKKILFFELSYLANTPILLRRTQLLCPVRDPPKISLFHMVDALAQTDVEP